MAAIPYGAVDLLGGGATWGGATMALGAITGVGNMSGGTGSMAEKKNILQCTHLCENVFLAAYWWLEKNRRAIFFIFTWSFSKKKKLSFFFSLKTFFTPWVTKFEQCMASRILELIDCTFPVINYMKYPEKSKIRYSMSRVLRQCEFNFKFKRIKKLFHSRLGRFISR
jgi:hypothetical protein